MLRSKQLRSKSVDCQSAAWHRLLSSTADGSAPQHRRDDHQRTVLVVHIIAQVCNAHIQIRGLGGHPRNLQREL